MILITAAIIVLLAAGTLALARWSGVDFNSLQDGNPSLLFNAGLAAVEAIALIAAVYLFGVRRRKISWAQIGVTPPPPSWLAWSVIIAMIFIPLIGLIALAIQLALGLPLENPQLEFLAPEDFSWPAALAMVLLGGILVPFAEELFFRGVFYRWLRDRFGLWVALILSSLVFGVLHGEISVAGATFVMGLVLAWFYECSRSLWPSVVIHALNNTIKLVLLYGMIATGWNAPF